jgi:chromosome segregation ATPase
LKKNGNKGPTKISLFAKLEKDELDSVTEAELVEAIRLYTQRLTEHLRMEKDVSKLENFIYEIVEETAKYNEQIIRLRVELDILDSDLKSNETNIAQEEDLITMFNEYLNTENPDQVEQKLFEHEYYAKNRDLLGKLDALRKKILYYENLRLACEEKLKLKETQLTNMENVLNKKNSFLNNGFSSLCNVLGQTTDPARQVQ